MADKDITGVEHTHAKSEPKKQILVYYFSPEALEDFEWHGKFEDIPLEELLTLDYSMFTVPEFLEAFNKGDINMEGLIRYVDDYEEPNVLKNESMIAVLDHSKGEVDILSNFTNNSDSSVIEDSLLDKGYSLQNISWMHRKSIKINFIND